MDILTTEGSTSSNDGIKETEKSKIKLNGELNGSVEGMDVDIDSHDSEHYKKDMKDSYSGDASNDSSARVNNGDRGSDSEDDGEEDEEDSTDVVTKEKSENSNSQQGFHESMDIEGDGASMNTDDEEQLLNTDTEPDEKEEKDDANQQQNQTQDSQDMIDTEEDEDEDEEGDINKEEDGEDGNGNDPSREEGASAKKEEGSEKEDGHMDTSNAGEMKAAKKKLPKLPEVTVTPRRSSRTVQKPVRFGQEQDDSEGDESGDSNESDIEEITPQDPLAADPLSDPRNIPRKIGNTTIVVSDTKRLADIAARNTNSQKKEPTLVIIDTNSILSGRGAVPIVQQPAPQPSTQQQSSLVKPYPGLTVGISSSSQNLYTPKPAPRPPPILPTLTDDMYVVEAPSFIVPYVYEKPPVKKFKKYLRKMVKQIKKQDEEEALREEEEDKKREEEEKQAEEAKANASVTGTAEAGKESEVETKEDGKEEDKRDESSEKDKVKETDSDLGKEMGDSSGDSGKGKQAKETKIEEKDDSLSNDNIEDSIKVNEIKREDGEVKVKESKVPVKKVDDIKKEVESSEDEEEEEEEKKKPPQGGSYFDNPLGKFFMQIGMNLVQEFVQTDLLKQHKKKQKMGKGTEDTQAAIISLKKNLQLSKENNEPYTMEQNKCDYCSFKTESKLIMAHHLETPHMRNYVYRCNFCPLEVRGPHDILFHMEAEHNIRGRLERAPAFHQCPQCPFEDNQKGKLTRHLLTCAKKFRPEKNLEPPLDWEPPAKIPRVARKPPSMPMNALASKNMQHPLLPKMVPAMASQHNPAFMRGRGRPNIQVTATQVTGTGSKMMSQRPMPPQLARANMVYRGGAPGSPVIVPAGYQLSGNQLFQVMGHQGQMVNAPANVQALQRLGLTATGSANVHSQALAQKNQAAVKLLNQPSISITPLPRQNTQNASASAANAVSRQGGGSKTTFVICEICDGYIKDLEQLRNHMQWIHKVKIHPKMIYNRPPLNCQKCQFRFFTDQGLERHLLGSHGLVTSSMQDSANKGKDGGRCPVCGRVYQWKLLNHVARDHSMTLKPAHLSYKCTVCTATFGMYKQFENHVYSAHSVVAKRVMDKKNGQSSSVSSVASRAADTASLLKPLKINDEITIIPQPAKKPVSISRPPAAQVTSRPRILQQAMASKQQAAAAAAAAASTDSVQVIDLEDSPLKHGGSQGENGGVESLTAVKERLRRRKSLEIRQVESEHDDGHSEGESESTGRSKVNSTNEDDDEDDDGGEGRSEDHGGDGDGEDEDDDDDDEKGEGAHNAESDG